MTDKEKPKALIEASPTNTYTAQNWIDLANHFQVKVQKRTSEVAFLQTKAGFLIAAAIIALQILLSMPNPQTTIEFITLALSASLIFASLILSIISMHMSKATSALNPDKMILDLTERPDMSRENFGKWLAKSYAKTNTRFNEEYRRKYNQQIISAILLLIALLIVLILKGVNTYV